MLNIKMIQAWNNVRTRQVIISDENQGPIVNLAAWIGMTFMVLCVFTRVFSKYSIVRKPALDDALILTTMVNRI